MHAYDAVVMDLNLRGCTGLDVVSGLRRQGCKVPVLVVAAISDPLDRARVLDAGADDVVSRPYHLEELLARVRLLLRRGCSEFSVVRVLDLQVDLAERTVHRRGRRIKLSPREFSLLECLALHAGEVVTRTVITESVWDTAVESISSRIDVYIRYLRRKIDDPFGVPLIHTRRGVGYMLGPE
jgi:two-component system, OmpR family, response regulator